MSPADRGNRVVNSHRIAVSALRLAALFGVAAVGWATLVFFNGGWWWAPFHAFLMGSVLLAISGLSQMFTVTWSASSAPPAWVAGIQRWAIALGAILVLVGIPEGQDWLVLAGGTLLLIGLGTLGFSLVSTIRSSLLRRFDLSSRFYLVGLVSGVVGIVLGIMMGMGYEGGTTFRIVHSRLNLVGLVGFTIMGTLPTLLPTLARSKAVAGKEVLAALGAAAVAAVLILSGLLLGTGVVGLGVLIASGALATVATGTVARFGKRGLRGGLPYLQVAAGVYWLVLWGVLDATKLVFGSAAPSFSAWIQAAVVVGVGQVLLGSLAYLGPVLVGPPPRLGRNLKRMSAHLWIPLILANVAGACLLFSWTTPAAGLITAWLLDLLRRLATLEWRSSDG